MSKNPAIPNVCIHALKILAIDMIDCAQSGHPGMALGFAEVLAVLYAHHFHFHPDVPLSPRRDRLVMSNGHGSALYYALLHVLGYPLSIDHLRQFRQHGGATPGHPERDPALGIDLATGPLGLGLAGAVGMAQAIKQDAARSGSAMGRLPRVYVTVGDGCLMEGVSQEAANLAAMLGLHNLVVLWDDNRVSIDGDATAWMPENIVARFRAMGWDVIAGVDGHQQEAIDRALSAVDVHRSRPTLIAFRTRIGCGTAWEDDAQCHGQPLPAPMIAQLRERLNWSYEPFVLPEEIYAFWRQARHVPLLALPSEQSWDNTACSADLDRRLLAHLLEWKGTAWPTRRYNQAVLSAVVGAGYPLVGASADLSSSTGVLHDAVEPMAAENLGNFLHGGVRELGLSAFASGWASQGIGPMFVSTFLVFSDYARPAIRQAALMGVHVMYIFSHDSLAVGEDGPTHQPIEQLDSLRLIPKLAVWRPGSGEEVARCWQRMLHEQDRPHALVLTRQALYEQVGKLYPCQEQDVQRGAYLAYMAQSGQRVQGTLFASGSELGLCVAAVDQMWQRFAINVQVVSVVNVTRWLDDGQPLPQDLALTSPRMYVEASTGCFGERVVGPTGYVCRVTDFGRSDRGKKVMAHFGFDVENVVEKFMIRYHDHVQKSGTDIVRLNNMEEA